MWDMKACLACLSTRDKLERISEPNQKLYLSLMGIKMSDIHGYPMYFCYICQAQIRKVLAFKRKCRRAYYVLKEIVSVTKDLSLNDIMQVNRKKTNLKYSFGKWKKRNTAVYFIEPEPIVLNAVIENMDQYMPNDRKLELVKKNLCTTDRVWHIDIMSTVIVEPEPEPESEPQQDILTIDTVNDPNEPMEEVSNDVSENVMSDFPQDVIIDDDDDSGLTFEFEKDVPKKKKRRPEEREFQSKILRIPTSELAEALSHAKIRCLSKLEQIAMFNEAKNGEEYRKALMKCALCLIVFDDLKALMRHTEKHNKLAKSKHLCDICKTKFCNEMDLTVHVAEKHAYEYKCKLCEDASYNIIDDYIKHSRSNHYGLSDKPLTCQTGVVRKNQFISQYFTIYPVDHVTMYEKLTHPACKHTCTDCNMRFCDLLSFTSHKAGHNKDYFDSLLRAVYTCDICGVFCKSLTKMAIHMENWHLCTYKCKICEEVVYNRHEALYHRRTKHSQKRQYVCENCGKLYHKRCFLIRHKQDKHYTESYRFHCFVCGDSFYSLTDLYKHQLTAYKRIRVFDPMSMKDGHPCDQCSVTFLSLKSYQIHAIRHDHEEAKDFENVCFVCKNIFDTREEYEFHLKTTCRSLVRYPRKCPYCDLIMVTYKDYRAHHIAQHAHMPLQILSASILCELCGVAVSDIVQHNRLHADEVHLDCTYCSPTLRFPDMWKYSVHMLTVHTPKPFICNLCSEAFEMRAQCKAHIMRMHDQRLTYKCNTCLELFFDIGRLLRHCKKYDHTTQLPKERKTGKMLYVYPHMKIDVSKFHPKLLSKLRLYLCDFAKTKRVLLSDINNYIYFENQDMMPPVVSERRIRTENLDFLTEAGAEFDLNFNESGPIKIIQDSPTTTELYLRKIPVRIEKKSRKKKSRTTKEPKADHQLNGSRINNQIIIKEVIKEESDKPLQEKIPKVKKVKLEEVEVVEESALDYSMGSNFIIGKEEICGLSEEGSPSVECDPEFKVEEEVVEETGVVYDMHDQGLETFEENGQPFINIHGVVYKLEQGLVITDTKNL